MGFRTAARAGKRHSLRPGTGPLLSLLAALVLSAPADAAVSSPVIRAVQTGNGQCDLDPSTTDLNVCTNSFVTYQIEFTSDGKDAPVTLKSTLPQVAGKSVMTWDTLPAVCSTSGSSISADGLTLTCVLPGPVTAGRLLYPFNARVLPSAPNGASVPSPVTTVASPQTTGGTLPALNSSGPVTVVAKPRYDLEKRGGRFSSYPGPNGEDGVVLSYSINVKVPVGPQGTEQVTAPLVITDTVPAGARLMNWATYTWGPNAGQKTTGCVPNGVEGLPFDVTDWGIPSSAYPNTDGNATRVTNGGTCTVSQAGGAGQPVTITISGADLTTTTYPTKTVGGDTISATEHYVTTQEVLLWVPMSSMTTGIVNEEINSIAFASPPLSISGQANNDPYPYNHTASVWVPYYIGPGYFRKTWIGNSANETMLQAGDGRQVPGATVTGEVLYVNTTVQPTQAILCDKFDNSRFTFNTARIAETGGRDPNNFVIEYGTGGKDGLGQTWASENDMKTSLCDDSQSSVWYTDPGAVPGGLEAISKIRLRPKTGTTVSETGIPGGMALNLNYTLEVRNTYAYSGFDGAVQGQQIPTGERLVNWSAYRLVGADSGTFGGSGQQDPQANWWAAPNASENARDSTMGDQITLVRGFASSRKSILPNDSITSVVAGSTLRYRVQPVLSTPVASTLTTSVTVRDVLPPGLSYVGGSATLTPTVQTNTPSTGYTTLTWTLNNVTPGTTLPSIDFDTTVGSLLSNGSSLVNFVTTTSPSDPSSSDATQCTGTGVYQGILMNGYSVDSSTGNVSGTLCRPAARRDITVSNPGGLRLDKTVSTPQIPVLGDIQYVLSWGGIGSAVDSSDLIDVLPYNGDGRTPATSFSGQVYLKNLITSITNDGSTASRVYYTSALPATIDRDPSAPTNTLGSGSTVWCQAAQFGTVACPADLKSVTAFRVVSGSTQGQNVIRSVTVNLTTTGNKPGDVYSNEFRVRGTVGGSALTQPVSSNTVISTVIPPVLGAAKTRDVAMVRVNIDSETGQITGYSPAQIKYTLTAMNNGNSAAADVHLLDTLPAGLTYKSFTVVSGPTPTLTQNGQQLDFLYASLPASSSAVVEVNTDITSLSANTQQTPLSNTATISSSGVTQSSETVQTDIVYPRLTKQVRNLTRAGAWGSESQAVPGDTLEYCIAANNYGTVALNDFTMSDTVPQHTTLISGSATATQGTASEAGSVISNFIPQFASGSQTQLCFKVTVK